jgi:hypothetical protein
MSIAGVSIILILGILNLVLVLFQLCTGMRWVKVPFRIHRASGILLVISALVHGSLAVLAELL